MFELNDCFTFGTSITTRSAWRPANASFLLASLLLAYNGQKIWFDSTDLSLESSIGQIQLFSLFNRSPKFLEELVPRDSVHRYANVANASCM